VFGIPDERLGEVVCAAIKVTKGSTIDEETVKNYCNGNVSVITMLRVYAELYKSSYTFQQVFFSYYNRSQDLKFQTTL
jgi:hypothetical protein